MEVYSPLEELHIQEQLEHPIHQGVGMSLEVDKPLEGPRSLGRLGIQELVSIQGEALPHKVSRTLAVLHNLLGSLERVSFLKILLEPVDSIRSRAFKEVVCYI